MKRPKGIYFVLIWLFISFLRLMEPLTQMIRTYNVNQESKPAWLGIVVVGLIALLIIIMVRLFRLDKFGIWAAIVLFTVTIILSIINVFYIYSTNNLANININIVLPFTLLFLCLNAFAIWYLLSKKFKINSEEFRKERELSKAIMPVK